MYFCNLSVEMRLVYYIKCLSISRIINIIRSRISYRFSQVGIYSFRHHPLFITVESANYCMLHCPQCPVSIHETMQHRTFGMASFMKVINRSSRYIHTMIFHFQGEPLLNNNLPQMIAIARQYKIYTMLSTNGLLMTNDLAERLVKSGLSHIIVSVDGISQKSYETYRKGGSLKVAIAAVGMINEARKKFNTHYPVIEIQCLMLRSNESEWDEMRGLYRKWGGDRLTFKTAQFYDYEHGSPLMPSNERYSRYRKNEDGTYSLKKTYCNHCYRLWSGVVIDAEGNVLPCCFDKERKYSFGNINEKNLDEIWQSVNAQDFRKKILHRRSSIDICRNCSE